VKEWETKASAVKKTKSNADYNLNVLSGYKNSEIPHKAFINSLQPWKIVLRLHARKMFAPNYKI